MKNKCCFFLFLLLSAWRLSAAPVTVSGQVTNADGSPAIEWPVFIGPFDPTGSGTVATTDPAGFYTLEVDLPAGVSEVEVQTIDHCGPQFLVATITASAATANFVLCDDPGWGDCWANAFYQLNQGFNVQFFGEGYGMDSITTFTYLWDLGDGTTSTEQNPTHTYATSGTYTVTLTVTSADCSNTVSLLVDVFQVQQVTVTGQVTDQNGAGVPAWFVYVESGNPASPNYGITDNQGFYSILAALPETATSVTVVTWDFCSPNGITGTAPIVNGTATIDLQICYDSFPAPPDCEAYITYMPVDSLTFQFNAHVYAKDSAATFSYLWDFGDGVTSTEQNPVHTYPADGVYSVLLTVTTSNGCVAHACEVICTFGGGTVDTFYYGCQAMFGVGWGGQNPAGGFDPLTLEFIDMSFGIVASWAWNFGDGSTDTVQNPVHTYASSGLYTVTLHITTIDGCESTISMEVYAGDDFPWTEFDCQAMFLPIPDSSGAGYYFLDLSISPSPIQSWQWDFGDGSTSTEQNPYHVYAQPGVYTVTLTIVADSCNSMISFEFDTNSPFGHFTPNGGVLGLSAEASSIKEHPVVGNLKVFPNPAISDVLVTFNNPEVQDMELRLSNLAGQSIGSQTIRAVDGLNTIRVPLQNMAPGLYILQLRTAAGIQSVRVVKE